MDKLFYFILGPESSGNRMMCDAIEFSNYFGIGGLNKTNSYEYKSKWNTETSIYDGLIKHSPKLALFTRSIPRGSYPNKEYIDIDKVCTQVINAGYTVIPIIMYRDIDYICKSQVARHHVGSYEEAVDIVEFAYQYISNSFFALKIPALTVHYHPFVTRYVYRKTIFSLLDLQYPEGFEFRNENAKYTKS
jgi:hypothetical protein